MTVPALEKLLEDSDPNDPTDPIQSDREAIRIAVDNALDGEQNADILMGFMRKHLPEQALGNTIDLNSDVLQAIAKSRPEWDMKDPDIRIAAFSISPGEDSRQKGYPWRLALTVVDVLAEFGTETPGVFTKDPKTQGIIKAILQRFADADLQTADSGSGLLRAALSATLNGALDAREYYDIEEEWLDALLDALQAGRTVANNSDEFLIGLIQGRGYPLLVGTLLEEAATRLADEDAKVFENIAADVLKVAGDHFKRRTNFSNYLSEHWGDLLRATLGSLANHGRELMPDESPLVKEVVVKVLAQLADTPNHKFLTSDMLAGVVDAAVGAVAAKPELLEGVDDAWLQTLIRSVTVTVAGQGIRKTFSRDGLTRILSETLETFADHPELIIAKPGLGLELVKAVLTKLSRLDRFNADQLANAAIGGALDVLADKPELASTNYPVLVASLAGKIGGLVKERSITGIQGSELLRAVAESVAENEKLFLEGQAKLAEIIVDAVMDVSGGDHGRLIAGTALVDVVQQVTEAMAANGRSAFDDHPLNTLRNRLVEVLNAGLARAQDQLGHQLGTSAVPPVLGGLVVAWARGEIDTIDPGNQDFQELFEALALRAAA
ncbi:hypothetical protein C6A37_04500 [Desulfobacteraceae bacterium SEEP-SAG9]|nr:hypothetical protein C6A37_04500 [Desulfobacteraceae bacterium SEEP-SAG9]